MSAGRLFQTAGAAAAKARSPIVERCMRRPTSEAVVAMKLLFLIDRLIDVARKLDKADREALSHCGLYLTRLEQYAYASEVYMKMGDIQSLVILHVKAKTWDEV